jgi:hypothetical protein
MSLQVQLTGGQGGRGYNGMGNRAAGGLAATGSAMLAVTPGATVFAEVAAPGADGNAAGPGGAVLGGGGGGGKQDSGGGGGASDVRTCSADPMVAMHCTSAQSLASRLVVMAGGGGGGGQGSSANTLAGGGGDAGATGGDGAATGTGYPGGGGGGAGTASAGGARGTHSEPGYDATAGDLGTGGHGGGFNSGGGGGGGGGLYGGGGAGGGEGGQTGGACFSGVCAPGGGGGGGSSGVPAGVTSTTGFSAALAVRDTPASITITWTRPGPTVTTGAAEAITQTGATLHGSVNPNNSPTSDCHFAVEPGGALYPCAEQVGGGGTPVDVSATATGLTAGTSYTFKLVATNTQGSADGADVSFATLTAAGPVTPELTQLAQSRRKWRASSAFPQLTSAAKKRRRKTPIGTVFRFALNEPAGVSFTFTRKVAGRKVRGVCRALRKHERKPKRRCTRRIKAGVLTVNAPSGASKLRFRGRLSRSEKLRPGRYGVAVAATDARGATTTPQTLSFTVAKR